MLNSYYVRFRYYTYALYPVAAAAAAAGTVVAATTVSVVEPSI